MSDEPQVQDRDWAWSAFIALLTLIALTIGVMLVLGCDPLECRRG